MAGAHVTGPPIHVGLGHWPGARLRARWRPVAAANVDADTVLVARARGGDRAAFEILVRLHAGRLYGVVLHIVDDRDDAEDVTQEALLRAWRSIDRFNANSQFYTWLYRIGVNEAKRLVSRRAHRGPVRSIDGDLDVRADEALGPAAQAEQRDLRSALTSAVRTLDPDYRTPLILRDVEGLSTAEAAAVMGIGEAAFKSRLHRARQTVREAVIDYLPE